MTCTSRRFYEANPKVCAAFIAALDEANALIARDKKKAAAIYPAVPNQKSSPDEILKILDDPDSGFSIVPNGTMKYADFMARAGDDQGEAGVVERAVLSAAACGRGKLTPLARQRRVLRPY